MPTQAVIAGMIVPGWNFFIEKFGEEFLKRTGLPSLGNKRSEERFEDFKEDIGKLLDHFEVLIGCVKRSALPGRDQASNRTAGDYLADAALRKELFAVLAPNPSDLCPVFLDRQTLLARCRQKEQAQFGGRGRPINSPERQVAEKIKLAYSIFGHTPSAPPGNGNLDPQTHGFEFTLFLHILGYLLANRPWFALAAQTGSFPPGVRETLVATAKERGFGEEAAQILPELGKELVKPVKYDIDPVLNFRCESVSSGIVKLRWDIPTGPGTRCDKVTLERRPSTTGSSWIQILRRERVVSYNDNRSQDRGEGFTYRIRSYFSGSEADSGPEVFVVIPDDPRIETARWIFGKVELIYSPAKNTSETLVYRRQGAKPQFKASDGMPLDAETELVARDPNARRCEDKSVQGGKSYWYTLATEYIGGIRTFSTPIAVSIPSPPGPPGKVSAQYKFNAETAEGEVQVLLQTSGPSGELSYELGRFEWVSGSPLTPTRKLLTTEPVPDKSWIDRDKELKVARQYVYHVRAVREGVPGPPSRSDVVSIAPGLVGLEADPVDRAIEVRYHENKTAKQVIVCLGEGTNRPASPAEGQRALSGPVSARASGLRNGQSYNISVFCLYELHGGGTALSERQEIRNLVPRLKPEPVSITARTEEGKIICGFTDPRAGSVKVIRLADAPTYRRNDKLDLNLVAKLGMEIPVSGRQAVDSEPDPRQPYYLALTIDDALQKAIVGTYSRCVLVPEIEDLRCFPVEGGVRLTWRWPEYCQQVLIVKDDGQFPEAPKISREIQGRATWRDKRGQELQPVERGLYEKDGDSHAIDLDPMAGDWRVKVFAVVGEDLSSGESEGCRRRIPRRPRIRLEYSLTRQNRRLVLKWRVAPTDAGPLPFMVLASNEGVPPNEHAGRKLFPPQPASGWPSPDPEGWRSWDIQSPYGADEEVYCRLFLDPSAPEQDWIAVRHPDNVLRPVAPSPRVDGRASNEWLVFRRPRHIRCPYCFDRFGWWQACLWDEDKAREHRIAWWRRLIARLVAFPLPVMPSEGNQRRWRRLIARLVKFHESVLHGTKKVCPRECAKRRRETKVPVEVGNALFRSHSLQLGLCGEALVGKSHWVFSAHQRLGSVGLQVADEETATRFDAMTARVVTKRAQLDRTRPDERRVIPPFLFTGTIAPGKTFVLVLCDIDGETWQRWGKAAHLRYVWASDALIVVLDPLQMPSVRAVLEARHLVPEDAPPLEPDPTLTNLNRALEQRGAPPYSIPLAVMVSKGDLLWRMDPALKESLRDLPLYHSGGEHPRYDMTVHWRVQFAVRDFLLRYEKGIVAQVERNFSNFAYFCVSQMGSSARTEGEYRRFPRFAPWRVEEPVYWILAQMGVIPTV